jgi:potassium efflux system protein
MRYTTTTLLRYAIIGTGTILVFAILGGNWSQIRWLVAALGVGIGFGLQEIVANFVSGLIILFERPLRIGDVVTVGDTSGVVTRIKIRATTIRGWDRRELLVPNREFITNRLLNWTFSDSVVRIVIPIGITYGSDAVKAMKLTEEAARENDNVLQDPPPFVTFEEFGDSSINLLLRAYIPSPDRRLTTASELRASLKRKFEDAGIVIAFPQRDVHFDTGKPLEIRMQAPGKEGGDAQK